MEGGRRRRWQHPATEALLHNAQAAPWVYIKSKRLKQTDSAKIPHRKKALTITAFAIFICMVPTVSLQVQRGEKKKQKKNRAKMLFSSPPRLTMRLIRVKGNRKRNSNYSIVAISVCIVTATKQTPDKSRFVLPCHCLSEPMEEMTNCRLEFNFFLWIGETLIQPSKSRTVVFGGGRWA